MDQHEIDRQLLAAGILRACWPNLEDGGSYKLSSIPHDNTAITLTRYVGGGQQTCVLRKPPRAGDAGIMITPTQWELLREILDATSPQPPAA